MATNTKTTRTKTARSSTGESADTQIRAFKDAKAWDAWLAKHQTAADGIWMRLAKKASGIKSITYPEAVEAREGRRSLERRIFLAEIGNRAG